MSTPKTVEWALSPPTARLRPFVDRYVGYRLAGFTPGVHRGLPSRHMTLIASIGRAIEVPTRPEAGTSPRRYGCVVAGLQPSPAFISHDGNQEGVAIELTPLGSRALLGLPAAELWESSHELSDAVGAPGAELWERLQHPSTWEERFAVCDQVLSRLVDERLVPRPLRHCWETLVASGGTIPVAALADEVGWSRQHLTRRFRSEFGAASKLAARTVRFDRAWSLLRSRQPRSLAQLAHACGYCDQAHLKRDFSQLAGCPPSRLIAEEVPFFQHEADGNGREWQP